MQHEASDIHRPLQTDAAMRDGTHIAVEGTGRRSVVQVDGETIGETEDDASQRVACTAALTHGIASAGQLGTCQVGRIDASARTYDIIVAACEIGRVASVSAHLAADDALWNAPLRVDFHALYCAGKQRRLRGSLAAADAHIDDAVRTNGPYLLCGDIDKDTAAGQFRMFLVAPAQTLHVALGALLGLDGAVDGELLLQPVVGRILRLDRVEEVEHRLLVGELTQSIVYESAIGLLDVDVIVVAAKERLGSGEAEALPRGIAQKGFSEIVFSQRHRLRSVLR